MLDIIHNDIHSSHSLMSTLVVLIALNSVEVLERGTALQHGDTLVTLLNDLHTSYPKIAKSLIYSFAIPFPLCNWFCSSVDLEFYLTRKRPDYRID